MEIEIYSGKKIPQLFLTLPDVFIRGIQAIPTKNYQ